MKRFVASSFQDFTTRIAFQSELPFQVGQDSAQPFQLLVLGLDSLAQLLLHYQQFLLKKNVTRRVFTALVEQATRRVLIICFAI